MKYLSGFYWERGRSKANQDSIVLQQVVTDYGRILLAAVSDGIGGLSEGENASGYIGGKDGGKFLQSADSDYGEATKEAFAPKKPAAVFLPD